MSVSSEAYEALVRELAAKLSHHSSRQEVAFAVVEEIASLDAQSTAIRSMYRCVRSEFSF